jgi:hypothetical protein
VRNNSRKVGIKEKSWEELRVITFGEGWEIASFCQKVPRLRPFVLLIRAV